MVFLLMCFSTENAGGTPILHPNYTPAELALSGSKIWPPPSPFSHFKQFPKKMPGNPIPKPLNPDFNSKKPQINLKASNAIYNHHQTPFPLLLINVAPFPTTSDATLKTPLTNCINASSAPLSHRPWTTNDWAIGSVPTLDNQWDYLISLWNSHFSPPHICPELPLWWCFFYTSELHANEVGGSYK